MDVCAHSYIYMCMVRSVKSSEAMLSNVARDNVAQLRTSPSHIFCTSPTRNTDTSINNGIVALLCFVTFISGICNTPIIIISSSDDQVINMNDRVTYITCETCMGNASTRPSVTFINN